MSTTLFDALPTVRTILVDETPFLGQEWVSILVYYITLIQTLLKPVTDHIPTDKLYELINSIIEAIPPQLMGYLESFWACIPTYIQNAITSLPTILTLENLAKLTRGQVLQVLVAVLVIYGLYAIVLNKVWPYVPSISFRKFFTKVPIADKAFKKEVQNSVAGLFKESLVPYTEQLNTIPAVGLDPTALLTHCAMIKRKDVQADGRAFAYVYETSCTQINNTIDDIFKMFSNTNALSPIVFPSLRYMENCITAACAELLHLPGPHMKTTLTPSPSDLGAVGAVTSGGSESVICAMKAHRDRARDLWGITEPEMIAPITVHPAFVKGAHLLNITLHLIPLVPGDYYKVDIAAYKAKINSNTALLIGSAPAYPHGIIDPITEICELARQWKLPVHVDACIGGFFLPFVQELKNQNQVGSFDFINNQNIEKWDFELPQVTSISLDLHKYAYAPKGASVIMYRSPDIRKYQYFAQTNWPGGLFVSPSLLGTRGGGPIAASWAALQLYGRNGYLDLVKETLAAKQEFIDAVKTCSELEIIGNPQSSIISWRVKDAYAKNLSIIAIGDALEQETLTIRDPAGGHQVPLVYKMQTRWKIEKQQAPEAIHMTIMAQHKKTCTTFRSDLQAAVQYVAQNNSALLGQGDAGMYGMTVKVPPFLSSVLDEFLCEFESQVMMPDRA
jgi:sphinganine-1-phosphate aldolase